MIERNIFSSSTGCAVACRTHVGATTIRDCIFWDNDRDVGDPLGCFGDWAQDNLLVDPLFCDPGNDDYRVRSDSPALTGGRMIGAYLTPGCSGP
jgi:hypothetical protein